jgi:predicted nucleic acid-binding protein
LARYCFDANVLIMWLFPGDSDVIDGFMAELSGEDELYCAPLLMPECTSVIREEVFDRRLTHDEAQSLVARLTSMPIEEILSRRQFPRALDLARRFQHKKAYDMQYLAVAELTRSQLVTRDRGLRHAAEAIGVPVRLLE